MSEWYNILGSLIRYNQTIEKNVDWFFINETKWNKDNNVKQLNFILSVHSKP